MDNREIRVLSVRQPYADQIIYGDKWNELRSWKTQYRGEFYIHASRWAGSKFQPTPGKGVVGAIIGRVELSDCRRAIDINSVMAHLRYKKPMPTGLEKLVELISTLPATGWDHGIGEWNWILGNPRVLLKPLPMQGKLNLWHADVDASALHTTRSPRRPTPTAPARAPRVSRKPYVPPSSAGLCLYNFLRKQPHRMASLRENVLRRLGRTGQVRVSDMENALKNHPVFQRVVDKPADENWWRAQVVPKKSTGKQK